MRISDTLIHTNEVYDSTYPSFGHFKGRRKLQFPLKLRDIQVSGLKSRVNVEMSFMKVIFSEVFLHTLYGAGLKDCKLVRYDYRKEKLVCRSRLRKLH